MSSNKINKLEQKIKRQEMLEQGAYDGRFKNKVVLDKKTKEKNKKWRWNKNNNMEM